MRRPVASARSLAVAEADARASLAVSLGRHGVFDLDPRTGTARFVGRLDSTLTPPSSSPPTAVAMGWVRRNAAALGLDRRDLRTLQPSRDYVDIDGTHHLAWTQSANGIEAFDNGLLASVTADGRLINVSRSPAHGLGRGATSVPAFGPDAALERARATAPGAATAPGDRATLVYFHGGRSHLAWRADTTTAPGEHVVTVIDATTGQVLWRADLSHDATGTGSAWGYFPSSKVPNGGGTQQPVVFPVNNGNKLAGNNAHVFLDARPDFHADAKDEVAAAAGLDWSSAAILDTTTGTQNCAPAHPCSWDYRDAKSWRQNLRQSATQAYYFINTFHDHLLALPIGFTEAAGNFQASNPSGKGKGHDAVQVHAFFGASSGGGVPTPQFTNNASMDTPPDGRAPTLVLLLFRRDRFSPAFPSANAGDDASIVYHEYTHGLSSRLVTYPNGLSALNTSQSGAMGEAWSDWYAMDLLVEQGYITDTSADGEVMMGKWITGGSGIRYQAIDCGVGAGSGACPGAYATGPGGFTLGDYGRVFNGPEVHSDGEIWGQTLWDLRDALGVTVARRLVTRAMELSPPDPSFLDMRNAILQADVVATGGANAVTLWNVFRHRGMGYFASSEDGNDTTPTPDGHTPPSCNVDPRGSIGGHVTDRLTGAAGERSGVGGRPHRRIPRHRPGRANRRQRTIRDQAGSVPHLSRPRDRSGRDRSDRASPRGGQRPRETGPARIQGLGGARWRRQGVVVHAARLLGIRMRSPRRDRPIPAIRLGQRRTVIDGWQPCDGSALDRDPPPEGDRHRLVRHRSRRHLRRPGERRRSSVRRLHARRFQRAVAIGAAPDNRADLGRAHDARTNRQRTGDAVGEVHDAVQSGPPVLHGHERTVGARPGQFAAAHPS
ncbi:MAG: M4 family metallopeptidase [Actinomycetota bacterium]